MSQSKGEKERKRGMKRGNIGMRFSGGALIGAVNGLLGGGGGMLAVPLLKAGGLSPRRAHATAIAVILPASAVSGLVYLFGRLVPFPILVPVALGVAAGGAVGAKLLGVLPVRAVDLLFGALMLLAGWRMLL